MKPFWKILGSAVLVAGAFGFSRIAKTGNTGKRSSVTLVNVDAPKIKNGAVVLSVNIAIDNPTEHTMNLKKPTLVVYFQNKQVGNSIPSDEYTAITANDRKIIKGINIQIPFANLGTLALELITGNTPKMSFDISMYTIADGIPYHDKKHFDL